MITLYKVRGSRSPHSFTGIGLCCCGAYEAPMRLVAHELPLHYLLIRFRSSCRDAAGRFGRAAHTRVL